jgi:uncharacterized protein YbbC (DUF1343 family)
MPRIEHSVTCCKHRRKDMLARSRSTSPSHAYVFLRACALIAASQLHTLLALLLLSACACEARGGQRAVERAPSHAAYHLADASAAPEPTPAHPPAAAVSPQRALRASGIRFVVEAALRRGELPGCVIAVGDHAGLRYLEAFGERTSGEPMTIDTRFDLASLTKPIATAASLMLLAERGQLELGAPAARYLPELELPDKRAIRIEQLLLHTSGLPKVNPLAALEQGKARGVRAIAGERLLAAPGARFEYSDLGFILLGEIVERVSGSGLDTFARQGLFEPLGMRDTDFRPAAGARRCAPTEERDGLTIRGVVDDPRAYRLGGVAGHAGLFASATDLARFAQMLLRQGELDGVRVLSEQSVAELLRPRRLRGATRTLGFDVQSSYALGRGQLMSERAVGHGGYTGTSLWLDPEHDLFVVLLSNRVHVGPRGSIHPLASAVADLALRAAAPRAEPEPVRVGIDVLQAEAFARLRGRRVALLTHLAARDAHGEPTLKLLARAPKVTLAALFSPEHGLAADAEGSVASSTTLGLPVHSLFGRTRKPSAAMLADVDCVVIDLVDVGTRFYTYMATSLAVIEAAAELGLDVVLLDRPNPIDGVHVEGPLSEPSYHSFVNYHPLPLRHGMTAGELARLLIAQRGLVARLHVVSVEGWQRSQWFEQLGLTWNAPSPNLASPAQALLYPAIGLVEGTNVSVGRGTPQAFRVLGAPFVDADALTRAIEAAAAPGVRLSATRFRPRVGPYAGVLLPGVAFEVVEPGAFSATHLGFAVIEALRTLYPREWDTARLAQLVAHQASMEQLLHGAPLAAALQSARAGLDQFMLAREQALLRGE